MYCKGINGEGKKGKEVFTEDGWLKTGDIGEGSIVVLSGKGRKEREGNREEMEWLRIDNRRIDNGNNHSVNEMD